MKNKYLYLLVAGLLCIACVEKPVPEPKPEPEPEPIPTPEPEPIKPPFQKVTLMSAFNEEFSAQESEFFEFKKREEGLDLRYFSAFPSYTERNKTILMLRTDPKDNAGLDNGAQIQTADHCFYGSYSAFLRIPDIKKAQPNIGESAILGVYNLDPNYGLTQIEIELRLADPSAVYVRALSGKNDTPNIVEKIVRPDALNAATAFYVYGFDWKPGSIEWWMKKSASGGKIELWKYEGTEEFPGDFATDGIPALPGRMRFNLFHSKTRATEGNTSAIQAPNYPFELEMDWIKYEPYKDLNDKWINENFNN